jgi:hypothetical protein
VSISSASGRLWSTPGSAGRGGQTGRLGVASAKGLTSAEWLEIAVVLHLRDGEIACVGCDDGVLAIGAGVDGLEGPNGVDVGGEGGLEALGPHSGGDVAADVLAG